MNRKNSAPITKIVLIFLVVFTMKIFAQGGMWVTAYYAGWKQGQYDNGVLPSTNIDYTAMTQIIHFSLVPKSDGSLDSTSNTITVNNSNNLIARAHAAGVKVIISVGGWNSDVAFRGATNSSNLSTFIANLIRFIKTRGYDGIDIDWETLQSSDAGQYVPFIQSLRSELDKISPRPILTAAVGSSSTSIMAQLTSEFDEINIMTYDLSGAWPGWVTWHNSPVYDGGVTFASTGRAVPSIDGRVASFEAAGVPASKLGIGVDFYGYIWSGGSGTSTGGATEPNQTWTSAPTVSANIPYYTIMQNYYQTQYYRWDSGAEAAYLSIDNDGSSNDKFISYDDEASCVSKVNYVKNNGLGGLIIWELGGGYRNDMPVGQQDLLLQSIKNAVNGTTTVVDVTPPSVSITSPANGSTVSGTLTISANASDNVGVTNVIVSVDGKQVSGGQLGAAPYNVSWNSTSVKDGSHTISVLASDAHGNSSTASINITVTNTVSDVTPPVVSITSPANNATVSGTITLTASASDNDGVSNVVYKVDGSQVGSQQSSSPYSTSWNTTQVSNGSHTVTATATDKSGNSSSASITVNVSNTAVDTTPPVVSLTSPSNNAVLSGSVNLSATATDQVGVASVIFTIDGVQVGSTLTTTPYSVSWNTTTASNGSHSVKVEASDAAGNKASATISVVVSNIINPPEGTSEISVYQDELNPDWVSSSWDVTVNYSSTQYIYSGTSSLNVDQRSWGGLRFVSGSWSSLKELDPNTLISLDFAIYGESSDINLNVYLENASKGSFPKIRYGTVPAGKWTLVSIPIGTLDPNNLPVGRVVVQDISGNRVVYDIDDLRFTSNIIADAIKPSIAINSPSNSSSVSGTVDITSNASDNVGVTGVVYKIDGNQIGSKQTTSPYRISWDSKSVADGQHTLTATASDAAGNESTASIIISVKNNAVVVDVIKPSISISSPGSNSEISGTVNLIASATDNVGVAGVIFKVDGTQIGNEKTSAPFELSWNTTSVSNGNHTLTAIARDAAGNESTASINITINNQEVASDGVKPTVTLSFPTDNSEISGTVNLSANATDNVGVTKVIFKLDGGQIGSVDAPPFEISWNSTSMADGEHTISATAYDAAGNESTVTIKVRISNTAGVQTDNSKPVVTFYSPINLAKLSGTVNLRANASDNVGVTSVLFKIDDMQIGFDITQPPFSTLWDTRNTIDGTHTLSVTAKDAAGNSSTTSIIINIANNVTDVNTDEIPTTFVLRQNYPNPFNPTTAIQFALPSSSHVTLEIFDILGERVATLVNNYLGAGTFTVNWNAGNYPSGIYIYRLIAGNKIMEKKMNLLK